MHDLACSLRPVPDAGVLPAPGPGDPRLERGDPFPQLVGDWQELVAFDITVNATTEEGVASKQITGPFDILEIAFRSSAAGTASQQLRLGFGDTSPGPQAVVGSEAGVPASGTTDSSRTVGIFYASNLYERHQLRVRVRTAITRLLFVLNNTTAGAVTIVGHVVIQHLRERRGGAPPDWY